jgi:hypothetical protein
MHETTKRIGVLNADIVKQCDEFFIGMQSDNIRWKLEVENRKKLFTMIVVSDLSVYTGVREKLNPFPRYVNFSEASTLSDVIRETLFKLVHGIDANVFCTAVIVELDGHSGMCLMVQHPERTMLLVNGINERFVFSPNSAAFEIFLATSVLRSYRFEGQLVVTLSWDSLAVGDRLMTAPAACVFLITIRALDPTCRTFLAAIAHIASVQHMALTTRKPH